MSPPCPRKVPLILWPKPKPDIPGFFFSHYLWSLRTTDFWFQMTPKGLGLDKGWQCGLNWERPKQGDWQEGSHSSLAIIWLGPAPGGVEMARDRWGSLWEILQQGNCKTWGWLDTGDEAKRGFKDDFLWKRYFFFFFSFDAQEHC